MVEITKESHTKEHGKDITETYKDVTMEEDAASTYDDPSVIGGLTKVVHNSAKKPNFYKAHTNPTTESITEGPNGRVAPDEDIETSISTRTQKEMG